MTKDKNGNRLIILLILIATCASGQIANDTIARNISDTAKVNNIQEVIVKTQRKKQFSDHANYSFDKESLERARNSKDLLIALPELQLDPITKIVISTKGVKVLFLINGVEASDNQMKSIAPTNVVRIEYYDIPPARFSTRSDIVVNIITKTLKTDTHLEQI